MFKSKAYCLGDRPSIPGQLAIIESVSSLVRSPDSLRLSETLGLHFCREEFAFASIGGSCIDHPALARFDPTEEWPRFFRQFLMGGFS